MASGDIWVFVEESLKTDVPPYFKTVLKACGYGNGITISAIEEEDLDYIKAEVRNGSVAKFFDGSAVDFLEGCSKSAKEFEFVLGHKKFLKAIVAFLKKHLVENGVGSFTCNSKKKAQPAAASKSNKVMDQKIGLPSKKKSKRSGRKMVQLVMKTDLEVQQNAPTISCEILAKHREILLIKTITGIVSLTPKMFEEKIDEIKDKLSGKFITFELDKDQNLIATIKCVFCEKTVTGYHNPSPHNPFLWKAPNFNRHLRHIHRFEDNGSQDSDTDIDWESNNHSDRKQTDENQALETVVDQKQTLHGSFGAKVPKPGGERKEIVRDSEIAEKETSNDVEVSGPSGQDEEIETKTELVKEERKVTLSTKGTDEKILHLTSSGKNTKSLSKGEESESASKLKLGLEGMPLILKNGAKTRHGNNFIVTKRTCAFDSVINSFVAIYSENSNVCDRIDSNHSDLSELIKRLFKQGESMPQLPNNHYAEMLIFRNSILLELYEGWCKSGNFNKSQETTFIDCKTGIGALFARICKFDKTFVSGIQSKNCKKCGHTFTKTLLFLKTTGKIRNLCKIGEYLEQNSQERLCALCKSKCEITTLFNNVVVLETEPTSAQQTGNVTLGTISKQFNIGDTPYTLRAVMHFDASLEHFVAYTHQMNDTWNLLDDLKKTGQRVEATTEVHPFILCYVSMIRSTDFENSIYDKKPVQSAAISPSQQKEVSQDAPHCDLERAPKPALGASQSEKKKRKKKHNIGKNQKQKKIH